MVKVKCQACGRWHEAGEEHCMRGVLLVCGGRNYDRWARVCKILDAVDGRMVIEAVRHGGARGADSLAGAWAVLAELPIEAMPADWEAYGNGAGTIRNTEMLKRRPVPILCVAFPGGSGTRDMVQKCERADVRVMKVDWRAE